MLKSAAIFSPDFEFAEPFVLHDPLQGWHDAEVWLLKSQAEQAGQLIELARRDRASDSGEYWTSPGATGIAREGPAA